jgi:hypothetical protein
MASIGRTPKSAWRDNVLLKLSCFTVHAWFIRKLRLLLPAHMKRSSGACSRDFNLNVETTGMKKVIGGMAAAAAMMMLCMSGASATPLGGGQTRGAAGAESMVIHVEGNYCHELRLSCENKDRLGEAGMGNCRRYREECGGGDRDGRDYCDRLRYKCNHKEELGQEGEGNCRRYRHECRGM